MKFSLDFEVRKTPDFYVCDISHKGTRLASEMDYGGEEVAVKAALWQLLAADLEDVVEMAKLKPENKETQNG